MTNADPDLISYMQLVRGLDFPDSNYTSRSNDGYVTIYHNNFDPEQGVQSWKLHVSVSLQDLPKAWKLVSEALVDMGVYCFKVAKPSLASNFDNPDSRQSGKMITIYGSPQSNAQMQEVAEIVDKILQENAINPGHTVKERTPHSANGYVFYTNIANNHDPSGLGISDTSQIDRSTELKYSKEI